MADTDNYDLTVSGLVRRRQDLSDQIAHMREMMAILSNDIQAIDRVLDSFGFNGELPDRRAQSPRVVFFVRNEMPRIIIATLKKVGKPMTTRELAEAIITAEGKDHYDRGLVNEMVRRVGKAGQRFHKRGIVIVALDRVSRTSIWRLA